MQGAQNCIESTPSEAGDARGLSIIRDVCLFRNYESKVYKENVLDARRASVSRFPMGERNSKH